MLKSTTLTNLPYSEERQVERAQAVLNLLQQDGLDDWAYEFWHRVLHNLSKNKHTHDYRMKVFSKKITTL